MKGCARDNFNVIFQVGRAASAVGRRKKRRALIVCLVWGELCTALSVFVSLKSRKRRLMMSRETSDEVKSRCEAGGRRQSYRN